MINLNRCREAAERVAEIAGAIPDNELPDDCLPRAILFMIAAIMDGGTEDELIGLSAYIQHFGRSHCEAFRK